MDIPANASIEQMVLPQTKKELKTAAGCRYTFSLLAALYNNMMRTIMLDRWALYGIGRLKFARVKNNFRSRDRHLTPYRDFALSSIERNKSCGTSGLKTQ